MKAFTSCREKLGRRENPTWIYNKKILLISLFRAEELLSHIFLIQKLKQWHKHKERCPACMSCWQALFFEHLGCQGDGLKGDGLSLAGIPVSLPWPSWEKDLNCRYGSLVWGPALAVQFLVRKQQAMPFLGRERSPQSRWSITPITGTEEKPRQLTSSWQLSGQAPSKPLHCKERAEN